jgi:alkanesulfonate monooxygenase SsuD/methylene tetrahydromethanopterin reductase-like flavin-dependent oxidoreductase (luciferase family)
MVVTPTSPSIGVLLPSRELTMFPPHDGDPRRLVDMAVRAEQSGFDSVWIGDSLLSKPRAEPLSVLAAVAVATSRVDLGTAVLLAAMRRAEQLAQQVATVDALANGRLILGVGAGPSGTAAEADYAYAGGKYSERGKATVDTVRRARELWRGDGLADDAERLQPLTVSPGGPRVWLGGAGPRSRQRAGELFDGWLPLTTDAETFQSGVHDVRQAQAAAGRAVDEVTPAAYLTINIGSRTESRRQLADHIQRYYGRPLEAMSAHMGTCAGSDDDVAEWLQGFLDAGARHMCLRLASPDFDAQLERLSSLLPSLKEA